MNQVREIIERAIEWGLSLGFKLIRKEWGIHANQTGWVLGRPTDVFGTVPACMCPISMMILYDQDVLQTYRGGRGPARVAAEILGVRQNHVESFIAGYDGLNFTSEDSFPWYELGQILAAKYKDKIDFSLEAKFPNVSEVQKS